MPKEAPSAHFYTKGLWEYGPHAQECFHLGSPIITCRPQSVNKEKKKSLGEFSKDSFRQTE